MRRRPLRSPFSSDAKRHRVSGPGLSKDTGSSAERACMMAVAVPGRLPREKRSSCSCGKALDHTASPRRARAPGKLRLAHEER